MRESARDALEDIYRTDGRAALATLIRLLGDFDLAEEALGEAWQSAVQQWPREGMPSNPLTCTNSSVACRRSRSDSGWRGRRSSTSLTK
jgi:predicted RNA polymerase sigma factor